MDVKQLEWAQKLTNLIQQSIEKQGFEVVDVNTKTGCRLETQYIVTIVPVFQSSASPESK